jgi:hypothetical protein
MFTRYMRMHLGRIVGSHLMRTIKNLQGCMPSLRKWQGGIRWRGVMVNRRKRRRRLGLCRKGIGWFATLVRAPWVVNGRLLMTGNVDPLLMNAFNNVNLAAACILTSTEFAMELGIPESKWIYPLGGAGTRDSYECECFHDLLVSPSWIS